MLIVLIVIVLLIYLFGEIKKLRVWLLNNIKKENLIYRFICIFFLNYCINNLYDVLYILWYVCKVKKILLLYLNLKL